MEVGLRVRSGMQATQQAVRMAHASTMQNLKMRPVPPAASRQEPASSCRPGAA